MNSSKPILLVDDQSDFVRGLARLLQANFPDNEVRACTNGGEAIASLEREEFGLLVTDLRMPGMSGSELMERAQSLDPALSIVLLTAHGTIETAVQAVKNGAYDFLAKPIDPDSLFLVAAKALERTRLLRENRRLRQLVADEGQGPRLIGEGAAMRRLKESIAAVAASDYTVLIRGESGTGKELVARSIHSQSRRAAKPLVSVNCPAIPEQLLESELFGHVKGAFTGADKSRRGLFLAADRGTLLLDEIGDIPLGVQTKLLRVLQEREVRPVGSSDSMPVDVRILASTNQALEERISSQRFRDDLFYRLNVLTIHVPSLGERTEDIPLLAAHFLAASCLEMGSEPKELTPEAFAWLAMRPWPGNVRELLNFIRRLAVFAPGRFIDLTHVRLAQGQPQGLSQPREKALEPYKKAKGRVVEEFTQDYVKRLLAQTGGNVSEAARLSGLERVSLQKILRRLGLDAGEFRGGNGLGVM